MPAAYGSGRPRVVVNQRQESGPDEVFVLGAAIRFDVSAAKAIIADGRPVGQIGTAVVSPVLGLLGFLPERAEALPDGALDEPLIFATTEAGRDQIIDGLHRIHAAGTRGRATLNFVRLTREESVAVQIGEVTL